jgi:FKBP-type peptidyl-prolyl cis-trans isomerase FkpA
MKKYLLFLALPVVLLASCAKTPVIPPFNAAQQAKTDNALILAYIAQNNITAVKDSSGLYYEIIKPGTAPDPTLTSTINVTFTGTLTNGTIFAPANTTGSALLSNTIPGWQIGIPKIGTGGEILLLVPSALGYGQGSPGAPIPDDAVLIFDVQLTSFTN